MSDETADLLVGKPVRPGKCRRGHPWTVANTILGTQHSSGNVLRKCRKCTQARDKRRRARSPEKRGAVQRAAIARAHQRGLPDGDPRHGTSTGRSYYGCKCQPCREWVNENNRLRRLRQKAERLGVEIPRDRSHVRLVTSLDAIAEKRFGMDRIMVGSEWDDPTAEAAVG